MNCEPITLGCVGSQELDCIAYDLTPSYYEQMSMNMKIAKVSLDVIQPKSPTRAN